MAHGPHTAAMLASFLAKSGEGSRGGQVLGHTASGHPIYAHKASGGSAYAGFSAADHFEAARAHLGRSGLLNHRARGNPQRTPQSSQERSQAARAQRHMAHCLGHIRRAKALDARLPVHERLEALA